MPNKLSVVIITKNEESFIGEAIKSALFADEVIVIDSGSSDKTCEIATSYGAKVLINPWKGFGKQKNFAVESARNNWIFVLDADERITYKLRNEILKELVEPKSKAYLVGRLNKFFGKYIKHCGLYPDYSIRLFDKNCGKFNDVQVHESFKTKENINKLKNPMRHLAYESVKEFYIKQKKYAELSEKNQNLLKAFSSPFFIFLKIYIFRLGFIDGWRGLVIAFVYAKYTFWKYIK